MPRSPSAVRSASPTAPWRPSRLAQRGGRLERLHHHAAVEQLVAQVGPGVAAAQPRLPRAAAEQHPAAGPQQRPSAGAAALHVLLVALEAEDRQAAALVAAHAQVAPPEPLLPAAGGREGHRQARLVLVREPAHVGRGVRLLHHPERLAALGEAAERPALVAARRGRGPHAQRGLGDHAQHALGAHHQLAQARAGGRRRERARAELARRARRSARPPPARRCARSPWTPGPPSAWPPSRPRSSTRTTAGSGRA